MNQPPNSKNYSIIKPALVTKLAEQLQKAISAKKLELIIPQQPEVIHTKDPISLEEVLLTDQVAALLFVYEAKKVIPEGFYFEKNLQRLIKTQKNRLYFLL